MLLYMQLGHPTLCTIMCFELELVCMGSLQPHPKPASLSHFEDTEMDLGRGFWFSKLPKYLIWNLYLEPR